jgi:hypothetical protein
VVEAVSPLESELNVKRNDRAEETLWVEISKILRSLLYIEVKGVFVNTTVGCVV